MRSENNLITRRQFLKTAGIGLGGLIVGPEIIESLSKIGDPKIVEIEDLLKNPKKYQGKKIQIAGVTVTDLKEESLTELTLNFDSKDFLRLEHKEIVLAKGHQDKDQYIEIVIGEAVDGIEYLKNETPLNMVGEWKELSLKWKSRPVLAVSHIKE